MELLRKIKNFIINLLFPIYLAYFRPLFKWLQSRFFGVTEIERMVLVGNLFGLRDCIYRTKKLPEVKEYFEKEIYNDEALPERIIEIVYQKKNIPRIKDTREKFVTMFTRLFNLIKSKQYVEEMRSIKFDKGNSDHMQMLRKFWNICTKDHPLPENMLTRDWIELGFQTDDPSTDFRGAGLLGMENLLYFCEKYQDQAIDVLLDSKDPKHQYFFAAAGIFITNELSSMMKEGGHFDILFIDAAGKKRVIEIFNEIYSGMFQFFNQFWIRQSNANMMNFNTIALNYFAHLRTQHQKHFIYYISKQAKIVLPGMEPKKPQNAKPTEENIETKKKR